MSLTETWRTKEKARYGALYLRYIFGKGSVISDVGNVRELYILHFFADAMAFFV